MFEGGETRHLRYKDLKELNDKLVLISGQTNYHEKVLHFTQVRIFSGLLLFKFFGSWSGLDTPFSYLVHFYRNF